MVEWTTAGDGEFDDATALNTIYTPGEEDINNESVELTLSASPIDPCVNNDSDKMLLSFSPSVGINHLSADDVKFVVHPNPTTGEFSVDVTTQKKAGLTVKLLNTLGEVIFTENAIDVATYNKSFNLQYLPKGIYFVKIETGTVAKTEKIVLN
jgi:hypothetical protein